MGEGAIVSWTVHGPVRAPEPAGNPGGMAMSDDGRYVAFHSDSSTLAGGDDNGRSDAFVWDIRG